MEFNYKVKKWFLSYSKCDKLINYYREKLTPSKVLGESYLRDSDDFYIYNKEISDDSVRNIVDELKLKFSEISGLPVENQELLTIIRYKPGQKFNSHYDSFTSSEQLDIENLVGGQRVWTFIVCLREADSGGYTHFDLLNESIKLKTGECIFWKNTNDNGEIYQESFHSGLPPERGEKWILSCWIRESKHVPVGHHFLVDMCRKFPVDKLKEVLDSLSYE